MAKANLGQLKEYLSENIITGSDTTLGIHLDHGAETVKAHGFLESSSRFAELHLCYTAHLLTVAGIISRPVSSESVEGVSTSYASDASDSGNQGETRYLTEYKRKRVQMQGLSGRLI